MAKLKAPLMSLGASGQLGKALVFFGWKGIDAVREYVIPANPKSTAQTTQRGYLTDAVTLIHALEAHAVDPLVEVDKRAYALYGSTFPTPRTWFNQMVMRYLLCRIHAELPQFFCQGTFTDVGAGETTIAVNNNSEPTAEGFFWCGTSPTSLITKVAADGVDYVHTGVFTGLTKGVKYYFQYRPTKVTDDKYVMRSGIYHHVQLA